MQYSEHTYIDSHYRDGNLSELTAVVFVRVHLQRVDPLDDLVLVKSFELAEHRESMHAKVRLS